MPTVRNSNDFIEAQLHAMIGQLEDAFGCHVLAFSGPLLFGVDTFIRDAVEENRDRDKDKKEEERVKKLVVILTTDGGIVEVVQRIVETFRHHYDVVDFVVPDYAYSAGTVMVMSGDAILMDYYSRLGPIDPQLQKADRRSVPALGYLAQYEKLIEKAQNGTITLAEAQLLIQGFDQAELYQYEQARNLSITLLTEWLTKYKFKNWTKTETQQTPVTPDKKRERAKEIAAELNNTQKWHSHGRGISKTVLRDELKLLIDDLEEGSDLHQKTREYHCLLTDYMAKMNTLGVVHINGRYRPLM